LIFPADPETSLFIHPRERPSFLSSHYPRCTISPRLDRQPFFLIFFMIKPTTLLFRYKSPPLSEDELCSLRDFPLLSDCQDRPSVLPEFPFKHSLSCLPFDAGTPFEVIDPVSLAISPSPPSSCRTVPVSPFSPNTYIYPRRLRRVSSLIRVTLEKHFSASVSESFLPSSCPAPGFRLVVPRYYLIMCPDPTTGSLCPFFFIRRRILSPSLPVTFWNPSSPPPPLFEASRTSPSSLSTLVFSPAFVPNAVLSPRF